MYALVEALQLGLSYERSASAVSHLVASSIETFSLSMQNGYKIAPNVRRPS